MKAVDVWKRYAAGWVLRGVTLTVRGVVVIYGVNGSGKSTLVKILAGLIPPTRGRVERRGRLGVVLQQPMMHPDLTVEENLRFYAKALGADHREVAEMFSLGRYLRVEFSHLSYGGGGAPIWRELCWGGPTRFY